MNNMDKWRQIEGHFSEKDAECYKYIAEQMPEFGAFLEIGAYKGRSTMCMVENIIKLDKHLSMWVVDTFEGDVHLGKQSTRNEFDKNMSDVNYNEHSVMIDILQTYSNKAFEWFKEFNYRFDGIFIDATHTYEAVKQDIELYRQLVVPGGIISGHDYTNFAGVKKAVDEAFPNHEKMFFGSCWLVRI